MPRTANTDSRTVGTTVTTSLIRTILFHHVGGIERQFLGVATARMTERPCSGASDPRSRVPRRDGPETSGDGRPAQSRSIEHRLTQGARHSDPGKADLDAHGLDRVHLLGNSPGGRVAIELACRRRALSVVSIPPCGLGAPLERAHQGRGDDHHPNDQPGSLSLAGRVGPHPRRPVRPTRRDARHAVAGLPSRCAHYEGRIRRPDRFSGPPCGTRS